MNGDLELYADTLTLYGETLVLYSGGPPASTVGAVLLVWRRRRR